MEAGCLLQPAFDRRRLGKRSGIAGLGNELQRDAGYSGTSAIVKLSYDPVNDVEPIILIGETGLVVVVHPSMPVKSVKELIAHAKANPGKLNYASVGAGSLTHLALELFKLETKVDLTHVPYKGGSPALSAVLGGEVQLTAISAVPTIRRDGCAPSR